MDAADLRALAKEREERAARQRPAAAASTSSGGPLPAAWAAKAATPSAPPPNLLATHRSIRLARMLGFGMNLLGMLFLVLGFGRYTVGFLLLGGIGLARGGGRLVHSNIPEMLRESPRGPTDAEVAQAATAGLFSLQGLTAFTTSVPEEYQLALDSLAFTCTYGKKNCLTNDMYHGPLSLGKICGLVWGKLREGVIRC